MTERKREERSRRSSSSISFSRPKKRWSSSGSKGRKPGNGLNMVPRSFLTAGRARQRAARVRKSKPSIWKTTGASWVRKCSFSVVFAPTQRMVDGGQRTGAAVADALLHLAQLAPHPALVGGAEEDHDAVAGAQILFVTAADISLIAFEGRDAGCRSPDRRGRRRRARRVAASRWS